MKQLDPDSKKLTASSFPLILVVLVAYLYPAFLYSFIPQLNIDHPIVNYSLTLISAVILGALAFWSLKKDRISLDGLGLSSKKFGEALLLLAAIWAVFGLINFLFAGDHWLDQSAKPLMIVQQWLFVGMSEELLIRGYLLNRFIRSFQRLPAKLATVAAVVLSSAIFATMHIPVRLYEHYPLAKMLVSIAILFGMGVIFSYIFLRTRNILFAGLAHGSWNVPLIGTQGDFLLLIIYGVVIEVARVIKGRMNRSYARECQVL